MAEDFEALPNNLQLLIDAAFDSASSSHSGRPPPKKRRKLSRCPEPEPVAEPTGGFIIDEAPGGFIIDEAPDDFIPPSREVEEGRPLSADDFITFSLIPTALQHLDLPPDDEEILQVFRNAAGGWSGVATADMGDDGGTVSRSDWRAVCAVVIGNREDEVEATGDPGGGFVIEDEQATSSAAEQSLQEDVDEEDADAEEDAYEEDESALSSLSSFSDPGEDSESDEYIAGPSKSKSKSKSTRAQIRSETLGAPTPRQKRTALEAYALFFPSSTPPSDEALAKMRLMYKDIVRVTDLLKEKIKADEITEMLSLFSTSPDLSLGFEDFTRIMMMAKLA